MRSVSTALLSLGGRCASRSAAASIKAFSAEVGGELGISAYAAERFVERSLKRLRTLLGGEGTREP
jgi:hypothetical protein